MTHRKFFCFILLLATSGFAFGQELPDCKSDDIYRELISKDPDARQNMEELEQFTREFAAGYGAFKTEAEKYIIPVVFHIIHDYGSENVSREQVLNALEIINQDFNSRNSDTGQVTSNFKGLAADIGVEFRLAKLDPYGECTDGITRTQSELTFVGSQDVKDLINWNVIDHNYMQVWVVNYIPDAGGYANRPNDEYWDGIVVRYTQFGSIGASSGSNLAKRTLTHEVGHYLNLLHTWGWGEIGTDEACEDDDRVDDTPNTKGNRAGCYLDNNTCGSLDNVENYMDYSTCGRMFTEGQKVRMIAALNSWRGGRKNLWQQENLVFTGTNDGFVKEVCSPVADFKANQTVWCETQQVPFINLSHNGEPDTSWKWQWVFEGGEPSMSTEKDPKVKYNKGGHYKVSLKVTNAAGTDQVIKNNYIEIASITTNFEAPLLEGMEDPAFPNDPVQPLNDWIVDAGSTDTWERTEAGAASGEACMRIKNYLIDDETVNSLISPNIDISNISDSLKLTFKVAYAQRDEESLDQLKVYISRNCGQSWFLRYHRFGETLSTTNGQTISGSFVPFASEWREESIPLNPFLVANHIRLKFEMTSIGGNTLYLDDINLTGAIFTGISEPKTIPNQIIQVYPNPFSNDAGIEITLEKDEILHLQLFNMIGEKIGKEYRKTFFKGNNAINLSTLTGSQVLRSGVYFIRITGGNEISSSLRVVKL